MIAGVGIDNVDVARIQRMLEEYGEQFEQRVFTTDEIRYCRWNKKRMAERYAARFAAKEAFSKAIGTGVRMGFSWREVFVVKERSGKPSLQLSGKMAERYGHFRMNLSLSHTDDTAMAIVILEES